VPESIDMKLKRVTINQADSTRSRPLSGADHKTAYGQGAQLALDVLLRGKWSIQVLCAMRFGPVRLGQLGRTIPSASKKMLAQALRNLEADGIVVRRDLSELVLHVEYVLHPDVRDSVVVLIDQLELWGTTYVSLSTWRNETKAHLQGKPLGTSNKQRR
jgi:DNA-binding HxlR family transcriptional regulator